MTHTERALYDGIVLNVGNLWDDRFLDKVVELNEQHKKDNICVGSLYGSIAYISPTARSFDRIPLLGWNEMEKYVGKCRDENIEIRYTLNASCIGKMNDFYNYWTTNLKNSVMGLHEIGIREWTISSALLVQLIHDMYPTDFIEISTINEVKTPQEASAWRNLGASGVCLSTSINRDIGMLKDIRTLPMEYSILANEACLFNCPYRRDCYNFSSHDSARNDVYFCNYPFGLCNNIRLENLTEWLRARVILPQWMEIIKERTGIKNFKVSFRTHPYETAASILELYMSKMHRGNYLDLWPSVSRLGDTAEPRESQFISCGALDDMNFFNDISSERRHCSTEICGNTCDICQFTLDSLRAKGQARG